MGNPTFGNGKSGRGGGTGSASVIVTAGSILSGNGTSVNPLDATIVVTPNTGIQGVGTVASPLAGIPATSLVPGTLSAADFAKLATVLSGGAIVQAFRTPLFVLTALTTGTVILIPITAGFYPAVSTSILYLASGAGVCTTGPSLQTGNNATEDNIAFSTALTAANVNAAIATGFTGGPCRVAALGATAGASTKPILDLSTPATVKVTVAGAGTGGFALSGFVETFVVLRAVGTP